ncbi:DUF4288 domain-containing protein [Sporosarcina sp. FSL K6-1522]|uniref:DUF4288 domain-containing protein n=1 Tax=Sporosarcina sp. FSL K6-1522 TaxID=2921554 RepID=UPI00315A0312
MKVFSVKLLLESIVTPAPIPPSKTFEESIILLRATHKELIEQMVIEHFVNDTYENAIGGQTTWRFVKMLDIFELSDEFEGDIQFKEVYSRFLPFDEMMTAEEAIQLYALDQ